MKLYIILVEMNENEIKMNFLNVLIHFSWSSSFFLNLQIPPGRL